MACIGYVVYVGERAVAFYACAMFMLHPGNETNDVGETESSELTTVIILLSLGLLAVLIIILALIICRYRRLHQLF